MFYDSKKVFDMTCKNRENVNTNDAEEALKFVVTILR